MSLIFNILFLSVFTFASPLRILCIYPVPFHSHQSVFQVMTEELAKRGHELVVLTPLPHEKPIENVTEIDVHDISYKIWEDGFREGLQSQDGFTMDPVGFWESVLLKIIIPMVDAQISNPEMQAIIKDKTQHFDIILTEACITSASLISARFDAPVVQVSSFFGTENNFLGIGAMRHPILFPEFMMQKINDLSFWDRVMTLYNTYRMRKVESQIEEAETALVRKYFGQDAPTIAELKKKIQLLLLNVHSVWDNNRPVPPSVIYMGALHLRKPKPIPKVIQEYLDNSVNGVIYMSLGSKIQFSDLPKESVNVFLKVFASLPYDILLKWNGGDVPNKPANLRLEKWLPQNDILHHPKIKVFMTQGGLQSADEAITANVPLIAFPVMGDQWFNAQKFVHHGIGKELDINNIDENELRQAILNVINDKTYKENIKSISRVMAKQRAGGLERGLYWIEYVAQYGGEHLRSSLADASMSDYLMLDIVLAAVGAAVVSLALLYYLVKSIKSLVFSSLKENKKLKSI